MTMPRVAFAVSTSGASPTMVTFSVTAPTCIARLTRAVSETVTRTCERVMVLKPERVAFTSYCPGGSRGRV